MNNLNSRTWSSPPEDYLKLPPGDQRSEEGGLPRASPRAEGNGTQFRVGCAPCPPAPAPRSLSMPGKGSGCAPSCCSTAISKSNLMWSTLAMISCMAAAVATPARLPLVPRRTHTSTRHRPAHTVLLRFASPNLAAAAAAATAGARGMPGALEARAGPSPAQTRAIERGVRPAPLGPTSCQPSSRLTCIHAPGARDTGCACRRSAGARSGGVGGGGWV